MAERVKKAVLIARPTPIEASKASLPVFTLTLSSCHYNIIKHKDRAREILCRIKGPQ